MDEARYLKRKVKAGRLDVHPSECAIVVHYEVEAMILGDSGDAMHGERKQCQKIIHLGKALSNSTNIPQLAQTIVEKCKLIHPTKLPELEQLLAFLQKRKKENGAALEEASKKRLLTQQQQSAQQALMSEVETYCDMLYEEMDDKVKATGMLLQLVRMPDNMEDLAQNERLLSALSRELRDNGKKSIELATNVVQIFFFFSSYSNFHDLIAQYKLGHACLTIVEHEIKQSIPMRESYDKKKKLYKAKKMTKEEFAVVKKKFEDEEFAQDTLLYVCLHLLLNVSEDTRVELKIRNKNIVGLLVECLKRQNVELLLLVVTFLKKLSVFLENKNEMVDLDIISILKPTLESPCEPLQAVALRLLLNLSFDARIRARLVELEILPLLVALMAKPSAGAPGVVVCILYHVSMDNQLRPAFENGDCLASMMRMILGSRDARMPTELLALGINLALNEKNAVSICSNGGLKMLMKTCMKSGDTLLFKMIRNLAKHRPVQPLFLDFIDDLAGLLVRSQDDDLTVEVLGILASLRIPDFDYLKLMEDYNLVDFIVQHLLPGAALDDFVLEIVLLVGTLLSDDQCAQKMATSGVVESLIELLKAKQEDDEFVLQIVCAFYRLVLMPSTRQIVLGQTEAVSYLLDLLYDKQVAIRTVCGRALDVIMEYDQDWAVKIRMRRFQAHNAEWLRVVLHEGPPVEEEDHHQLVDDPYSHDEYAFGRDAYDRRHSDMLEATDFYDDYATGREGAGHGRYDDRGAGQYADDRGNGHYDDRGYAADPGFEDRIMSKYGSRAMRPMHTANQEDVEDVEYLSDGDDD